ncbi:MAG: LysM peptidoglycan-binding domain-containing protein [Opitutae bacterium]|nr:LysM peptidoglycan-binding domain-containing protein [Opitutae bacterium]
MKIIFHLLPMVAGLAFAGTGCVTTPETEPPAASQADVGYLREEIRRLNARLDASDAELGRVQGEVVSARSSQPATASAAQVQSMQTQLDDHQRQIRALDAARAQDKKEIYDDISKKIATLLKASSVSSAPARSTKRSASQNGIEHVVQSGESLSKIAAAYGVKMSVLVEENALKSPDSIFVGQKLFIPE